MLAFRTGTSETLTVAHLSDGGAELTLKDLLQRLELVPGHITWLLQLLQQLDGPGNIWQKEGEIMCVGGYSITLSHVNNAEANQWVV